MIREIGSTPFIKRIDRLIMLTFRGALALAGLATSSHALVHELVVGNFVNNVLYTLSFDDEIYSLDLIANISVTTRNSWLALNVRQSSFTPSRHQHC
jgi:hypothetical protein